MVLGKFFYFQLLKNLFLQAYICAMLTKMEEDFVQFWETNRLKEKKNIKTFRKNRLPTCKYDNRKWFGLIYDYRNRKPYNWKNN